MSFDIKDQTGSRIGSIEKDAVFLGGSDSYTVKDVSGYTVFRISKTNYGQFFGIAFVIVLTAIAILLTPFVLVYRKQKSALIILPTLAVLTAISFSTSNIWILLFTFSLGSAFRMLLILSTIQSPLSSIIKTFIGWTIVESVLYVFWTHGEADGVIGFILFFIFSLMLYFMAGKLCQKLVLKYNLVIPMFVIISTALSMLLVVFQNYSYYSLGYKFYDLISLTAFINAGILIQLMLIFHIAAFLIALPLLLLLPNIKKIVKDW